MGHRRTNTRTVGFARWEDIDFGNGTVGDPGRSNEDEATFICQLSEQVIMLFKQLEPPKHHPLVFIGRNDPANQLVRKALTKYLNYLDIREDSQGTYARHTMSYPAWTRL